MSDDASEFVDVVSVAEIGPGAIRPFEVAGHELLICRAGDEYFAIESKCSHTGALLAGGRIRSDCIVCPVHGARFRLRDGKHLSPPASSGLHTFSVRVTGGRIQVRPVPIRPPGGGRDPNAFRA